MDLPSTSGGVSSYPDEARFPKVVDSIGVIYDPLNRPILAVTFTSPTPAKIIWFFNRELKTIEADGDRYHLDEDNQAEGGINIYKCGLLLIKPESRDQGDYKIIAQNDSGTTDLQFTLHMGLDCVLRVSEESIFPPSAAPPNQQFTSDYSQLREDGRLYGDIRPLIAADEVYFRASVDQPGYYQVLRRKDDVRLMAPDQFEGVRTTMWNYLKEHLPEQVTEIEARNDAANQPLVGNFWRRPQIRDNFLLRARDRFPAHYSVQLLNAVAAADIDSWTRGLKAVEIAHIEDDEKRADSDARNGTTKRRIRFATGVNEDGEGPFVRSTTGSKIDRVTLWDEHYTDDLLNDKAEEIPDGDGSTRKKTRFSLPSPERRPAPPPTVVNAESKLPFGLKPFRKAEAKAIYKKDRLEVVCFIGGLPKPTVQWFNNKKLLEPGGHINIAESDGSRCYQRIVLNDVNYEELAEMNLTCRAENYCGVFEENIVVDSRAHPRISFAAQPIVKRFLGKTEVELYCRLTTAERSFGSVSRRWEKDGVEVYPEEDNSLREKLIRNGDGSFTVTLLVQNPDAYEGFWQCFLHADPNGNGRRDKEDKPFIVSWNLTNQMRHNTPYLVQQPTCRHWIEHEGEVKRKNALFSVYFRSSPGYRVEWINPRGRKVKNSERIVLNAAASASCYTATLKIRGVIDADSGRYTCRITSGKRSIEVAFGVVAEADCGDSNPERIHHDIKLRDSFIDGSKNVAAKRSRVPGNSILQSNGMKEAAFIAELKNRRIVQMVTEAYQKTKQSQQNGMPKTKLEDGRRKATGKDNAIDTFNTMDDELRIAMEMSLNNAL